MLIMNRMGMVCKMRRTKQVVKIIPRMRSFHRSLSSRAWQM
jgi:hypothetical protein